MPRRTTRSSDTQSGDDSAWTLFAKKCPRSKHLTQPVLYAMPKRFVDILCRTVPKLLTKQDIAFEHALREYGGTAFVHQQSRFSKVLDRHYLFSKGPIDPSLEYCPNFDEFCPELIPVLSQEVGISHADQVQDLLSAGRFDPATLEHERKLKRRVDDDVRLILKAYVAWMVTHPEYWIDALRLRAVHGGKRVLPEQLPGPALRDRSRNRSRSRAWKQYQIESDSFLTKWALSGMTTVHLPEPLEPGLFPDATVLQNGLSATGASMYLPWSLMADLAFKFRDLSDFYRQRNDLSHLQEWLEGEKNWGPLRYARMLDLYVYLELALKQRYPERVDRRIEQIDRAFAAYWLPKGTDPAKIDKTLETVKDIRQKMAKRLRTCQQKIDEHAKRMISGQEHADWLALVESGFEPPDSV